MGYTYRVLESRWVHVGVRVVVGMVGTRRPLWVVGIRGSSPSVGTRGPLLFVGCGTGGGRSLSEVVDCRRRHSLGSWHHGYLSLFESRRRRGTPGLTVGVPHQPFAGGAVGIDSC